MNLLFKEPVATSRREEQHAGGCRGRTQVAFLPYSNYAQSFTSDTSLIHAHQGFGKSGEYVDILHENEPIS